MTRSFSSSQIAQIVEGKLTGDENIQLVSMGPPHLATENILAIAFEKEHMQTMPTTKALCVLIPEGVNCPGKTCITVERPKLAMGKLLHLFYQPPEAPVAVHPSAVVDPSVTLGQNVSIGPFCTIGSNTKIGDNTKLLAGVNIGVGVEIGNDCLFYPNVYVGDRVIIKNKVILHSGARIGNDGFSFITEKTGNVETARQSGETGKSTEQHIIKIPSIGSVIIEEDVEIGANTTIDRGTIENTIIGKNTKIDNLVQIGHNVVVGESCFIVSQVGISGSCKIGNRVVLAGQVGLADHLTIGDDVIVTAQSGVSKNISAKEIWSGTPAMPIKQYNKQRMHLRTIPEVKEQLKKLEQKINELNKEKVK